jgi:hypothetical protein
MRAGVIDGLVELPGLGGEAHAMAAEGERVGELELDLQPARLVRNVIVEGTSFPAGVTALRPETTTRRRFMSGAS